VEQMQGGNARSVRH